ncbi:MAG TPA: AraC family transcriptional regulator [Acidocella sp.]|jgi:AraC-like DNA-binding protein|uniref:AraC family transcriptional regulator n=1 Tax=Acidocella sp. TaxID=50710 RepID=UPI002B6EAB5B|nr:AraC family transcriptional regulator [Acidocella sp.]HVE21201.1 AraC family transcriptional regulator [Acidocella sp.]
MDERLRIDRAACRELSTGPWLYRRPAAHEIVELAMVRGAEVALPTHFHDEDQITFVLSGRRRFRVDDELIALCPGQGLFITAGTPHSSLPEPDGVVCFNAYLGAGVSALSGLVEDMARHWARDGRFSLAALKGLVRAHRQGVAGGGGPPRMVLPFDAHGTIREAAEQARMSREGFSRRFRRTRGVTPSQFRSLMKLNQARLLLRAGLPLAAAAAEAGFADQSHLGRCFRRAFGVTPGVYRAGWERSHPFQTGSWSGF